MGTTADKLNKLLATKSSIKQAIINKGVDVSDTDTFESYAGKIGQISGGGGIPSYVIPRDNVNGVYKNPNTITSFNVNGATDITSYGLYYAFYECSSLLFADLSSIISINGVNALSYAFNSCSNLEGFNLNSLTSVISYGMDRTFYGCRKLKSANLSSLTTINGSSAMSGTFYNCIELESADVSSLRTINGSSAMQNTFYNCSKLARMDFPSLKEILPATTQNQFGTGSYNYTFGGCTALTEIHFPSNMESRVSQLTGYADKWGAVNATIYFDLPSTEA